MQVTPKSRFQVRLQYYLFIVLFIVAMGLLAWISNRYSFEADWTANQRNSLSPASIALLERIQGPVTITAFASDDNPDQLRVPISEFIGRYQRYKPDIELRFINPETSPQLVRDMGIRVDGELVVEYQSRTEHVQRLNEQALTNALQRLMRSGERKIVFVTGHGERNPDGDANFDLGEFTRRLTAKGFRFASVNLVKEGGVPEDTAVLIIAGPQVNYLPGEVALVRDYVKKGGNLLWLHDPGDLKGLKPLAEELGIFFVPGIIIDPTITLYIDTDETTAVLITPQPVHPITRGYNNVALFPQATGINFRADNGWIVTEFLTTSENSWSETGPLVATPEYDEGKDVRGPLAIGLAMSREAPTAAAGAEPGEAGAAAAGADPDDAGSAQQRVVVMGDGDFIANTYLGNAGNMDLGMNILNWLSHDDSFIAIPARAAPDTSLTLGFAGWVIIKVFFALILPLALLGSGIAIWLRRRKQ